MGAWSASWGQMDNMGRYIHTPALRQILAKQPVQGFYSEPPEMWLPEAAYDPPFLKTFFQSSLTCHTLKRLPQDQRSQS